MSISGLFSTSVSGMNAQSNKLSTVGENIANANTAGYKRRGTEFSSLILPNSGGTYNSGSVETQVRTEVSRAGSISSTSSASDLAIAGDGMFVVQDQAGREFFTRAGSFVPRTNPATGETNLVNAAGYKLVGTVNGGAREPVNLPVGGVVAAQPTASGNLDLQLPASEEVGTEKKTSFTVYDSNGSPVEVNVTMTKTGDDAWTVEIAGDDDNPGNTLTYNATFDDSGEETSGVTGGQLTLADGTPIAVGVDSLTQYDRTYSAKGTQLGGRPDGVYENFRFADDGTIVGVMDSGATQTIGVASLAKFQSPDQLEPGAGNVFSATRESGAAQFGVPGENGLGLIQSGALEQSNVDLANELTSMIQAQRSYSANSKTFQTADEVMQTLVNLKR